MGEDKRQTGRGKIDHRDLEKKKIIFSESEALSYLVGILFTFFLLEII